MKQSQLLGHQNSPFHTTKCWSLKCADPWNVQRHVKPRQTIVEAFLQNTHKLLGKNCNLKFFVVYFPNSVSCFVADLEKYNKKFKHGETFRKSSVLEPSHLGKFPLSSAATGLGNRNNVQFGRALAWDRRCLSYQRRNVYNVVSGKYLWMTGGNDYDVNKMKVGCYWVRRMTADCQYTVSRMTVAWH